MRSKRLKINFQDVEDAFNRKKEESACYLDRVTGHVVMEGEGEDDDLDQVSYGGVSSLPEPVQRKDDAMRLYVRPPGTARKIEWLKVFLERDDELNPEVKSELSEALGADDPAEVIGEILRQNPDERDAWFLYRADRVRELIDEWLKSSAIEPVDPPPWRG